MLKLFCLSIFLHNKKNRNKKTEKRQVEHLRGLFNCLLPACNMTSDHNTRRCSNSLFLFLLLCRVPLGMAWFYKLVLSIVFVDEKLVHSKLYHPAKIERLRVIFQV